MQKIKSNKLLEIALAQVPRLLGQLNRNPSSKNYGSFDRAFWHYRTNDISCARYQEAVYALALLYCSDFENNEYYKNPKLLEWIRASFRFTASLQRRNGSFDEWYVNEGSYVATAFLTAALGQTILLLRDHDVSIEEEDIISSVLVKAAEFLVTTEENTVMNQVSGAIFAITAAGRVNGREDLIEAVHHLMDGFVAKQNKEGWWSEYGGPDIGYLTLTISYLEKYKELTGSKRADLAISKAKTFVGEFINPDMTAGGEYMSRNTEYIVPSKILPLISAVGPAELDDRYLAYILYNWLETGLAVTSESPEFTLGTRYYDECKIVREVNKSYFFVANAMKGGSFRIYANQGVYFDSGLELTVNSRNFSTGILDDKNTIVQEPGKLYVSGFLKPIKEPVLDTKKVLLFKGWQFIFGRLPFFQKFVKNYLRPRMISYSKSSKIFFERKFEYSLDSIMVTDIVHGPAMRNKVLLGVKAAYSAVPSSKYVSSVEMQTSRLTPLYEEKEEGGMLIIKRTFIFKN